MKNVQKRTILILSMVLFLSPLFAQPDSPHFLGILARYFFRT